MYYLYGISYEGCCGNYNAGISVLLATFDSRESAEKYVEDSSVDEHKIHFYYDSLLYKYKYYEILEVPHNPVYKGVAS